MLTWAGFVVPRREEGITFDRFSKNDHRYQGFCKRFQSEFQLMIANAQLDDGILPFNELTRHSSSSIHIYVRFLFGAEECFPNETKRYM